MEPSANRTLEAIWAILYTAQIRVLDDEECDELAGLCELIGERHFNSGRFVAAAEQLRQRIVDSGVLQNGMAAKSEKLLEHVDEVRRILAAP